jgi:UDP-glucose 4-epimerase
VNALVPPGLRVVVTGPTGDIGRSLLRALEREPGVREVVAMARRGFDPAELGLTKTEYRRGDVLDRVAVEELVNGADVVVHLAFLIVGGREETEQINLDGSRTVFEASVAAGAARLVYTSSVAAYGFCADNPPLLTEDVPPRGTERHYYAAQKAKLESALNEVVIDSATDAYVFRPSVVAGPDALALLQNIPYLQLFELLRRFQNPLTAAVLDALARFPNLKPVLPDPGTPFQLVHHDDVAEALLAGVLGRGEPGVYNLAASPPIRVSELASELGWYSLPIPETAIESLSELVARLPLLPAQAQWVETLRQPVLVDTTKAREKLGWVPQHDGHDVLREMVAAARERGLLDLG